MSASRAIGNTFFEIVGISEIGRREQTILMEALEGVWILIASMVVFAIAITGVVVVIARLGYEDMTVEIAALVIMMIFIVVTAYAWTVSLNRYRSSESE
jgi:limonene-1,2-epoxide hydrolase